MITDNTGAKKIEGTDNWRLIFDAHNDSVDAHSEAIQQIATVITGTTNNSGHAISANEYFIADGAKYKASQTIDTGATWAGKCTSVSDHDLINALNSKLTTVNTITGVTGVTVSSGGYIKAGRLVIVNVKIVLSSEISVNNDLIYIPTCLFNDSPLIAHNGAIGHKFCRTYNAKLVTSESFPAGTYQISGSYISAT